MTALIVTIHAAGLFAVGFLSCIFGYWLRGRRSAAVISKLHRRLNASRASFYSLGRGRGWGLWKAPRRGESATPLNSAAKRLWDQQANRGHA